MRWYIVADTENGRVKLCIVGEGDEEMVLTFLPYTAGMLAMELMEAAKVCLTNTEQNGLSRPETQHDNYTIGLPVVASA